MQTFKHLEHSLKQGFHVNLAYGVGRKVGGNIISSNGTIFSTRRCTLREGKMFSHVCLLVCSCRGRISSHVVGGCSPYTYYQTGCWHSTERLSCIEIILFILVNGSSF